MQAIVINQYGGINQLHKTNLFKPNILPNEVLVQIYAFSINPLDTQVRKGVAKNNFSYQWEFPAILGWDLSGIIVKAGSQVKQFKIGDAIIAEIGGFRPSRKGSNAQFVAINEKNIAPKPQNLSFDQAAAVPMGSVTAWQAITKKLRVKPHQRILIQGGAGGVGLFAIQIAKLLGAYIVTTASPNHSRLLKKLGADKVIDYHKHSVDQIIKNFDGVFDTVGDITNGLSVLRKNGRLVSIVSSLKNDSRVIFFLTETGNNDLSQISSLFAKGKLHVVINHIFPFSEKGVRKAHKQIEGRHVAGKLVVHVKS